MRTTASMLMILTFAVFTHAQPPEFTYQGRLTDGSLPASGNYQMQFSLFGSLADPDQIGSTITVASVTVTQGVFTVTLNFDDSNAFTGGPRWLAIAVKRAADPSYTPLLPRQPLTSAPYAIKSLNASTADLAINSTQLGGVDANQYVVTTDPRMSDERAPTSGSGHYIQNGVSQQPSSNFNISGNGFVAGSLGVGTLTPNPDAKFEVSGSGFVRARVNSDFNGGFALALNNQPKWSIATAGTGQFQIFNDAIVQNAVWIDPTNNNFGIGTIAPGSKLDVAGHINTSTQYNIGGNRILSSPGSVNLFAGVNAGVSNTGGGNAFFGDGAGRLNSVGNGNSFFGRAAGENSTTGSGNSFFGATAGQNNTSSNNAFFGAGSGRDNAGGFNAFFGYQSGMVNSTGQLNAFFGSGAGIANTTGLFNSFFGAAAGAANINGTVNSFFGTETGDSNINGHSNSFFGRKAGDSNTSGSVNVFVGIVAGQSNVTGHYNTIVGGIANVLASDLSFATALGAQSRVGTSDTIVLGKVAGNYDGVARPADTVQIPGDLTVTGAINGTVLNATNAVNATNATTAQNVSGIVAIENGGTGSSTKNFVDLSTNQTIFGNKTFSHTASFSGASVGSLTSSGSATFNGSVAFNNADPIAVSGTMNIGGSVNADQVSAGEINTSGILSGNIVNAATQYNIGINRVLTSTINGSTFVGIGAGANDSGSGNNTIVGFEAGFGNNGIEGRNSIFGSRAGHSNTGRDNSFFGYEAGELTTTGRDNSFFGRHSGASNTTGNSNSFYGFLSGRSSLGSRNSFFGSGSGLNNTSGSGNAFFGEVSGQRNVDGSSNTLMGEFADVEFGNLTNATAVGARAFVSQSNSLVLGSISGINDAVADTNVGIGTTAPATKLHISGAGGVRARVNSDSNAGVGLTINNNPGWSVATVTPGQFQIFNDAIGQNAVWIDATTNNVGIGTVSSAAKLDVGGTVRVGVIGLSGITPTCFDASLILSACSSSGRYKSNVHAFSSGLDLVRKLRPVSFNWKANNMEDLGLVAEEVAAIEPLLVTRNDKGEVEGVKYDRIGVVLINVVKEQQAQLEAQQKQIDALKSLVCETKRNAEVCKERKK